LYNSKTTWETYRQKIQGKVNLSIKLEKYEYIELETNNLLSLLQHAAKEATPNTDPQRTTNNMPYEIKKVVAEKRKARSIWQRIHTPDSRRKYYRTSNKLQPKLQEMQNESYEKYVSYLKRQDNSI
jgi:hypothetical protein